jgi:valyl-tRNA synthetase
VDVAAESARLQKEIEKADGEIAKVLERLNNPSFAQKVPPNVLAEHQKRLAEWQGKRERAATALQGLASLAGGSG